MKLFFLKIKETPIYELMFYVFLFVLPFQTRIIYQPTQAYIAWYFSYPLAIFLYLSDVVFLGLLASWLFYKKKNVSRYKTLVYSCFLLILWAFLGLFYVKHFSLGVYQALKWFELIVLVLMTVDIVKTTKILANSAIILYLSGVFQAILGILQFHVQHSIGLGVLGEYVPRATIAGASTIDSGMEKLVRAYGTFPHPNVYACFLLVSLIFGLWYVSRETSKVKQNIAYLGLFLISIGIFLSFSRLIWFTSLVIVIAYFVYLLAKNRGIALKLAIIAVVSCGTILIFWQNLLFSRVKAFPNSSAVVDRETFNNYGFQIFKDSPLIGTGIGNYIPTMIEKFHPPESLREARRAGVEPWQYQPSHNIFIYIAASLGIVGLILFLHLLWTIFRSLWKSKPSSLKFTLSVLFIAIIFISNFDHFFVTIQQGQLLFFLSLGLIAAYNNLERNAELDSASQNTDPETNSGLQ